MTTIKEVIQKLEEFAPPAFQESYDNAGLIVGDSSIQLTGILVSLDSTETVIEEAIQKGCNMIVAHHPIVFKGLKKITGFTYVERVIISAIKNNIAIYAMHTNLDSVSNGVNKMISDRLGLNNTRILRPKKDLLFKLIVFVPSTHSEKVRTAIFDAGGGHIGNYSNCSFNSPGTGTFKADENADPFAGKIGETHHEDEVRIEVVIPKYKKETVVSALLKSHPYEEVAYDLIPLENDLVTIGSGMIGELEETMSGTEFLNHLKNKMKTNCIRYTTLLDTPVKKVALCGGSGAFLIANARGQNADVFVTGDVKYHEFFDADNQMVIMDIGHYESERFTVDLIHRFLIENFSKFAVRISEVNTNPINYF